MPAAQRAGGVSAVAPADAGLGVGTCPLGDVTPEAATGEQRGRERGERR